MVNSVSRRTTLSTNSTNNPARNSERRRGKRGKHVFASSSSVWFSEFSRTSSSNRAAGRGAVSQSLFLNDRIKPHKPFTFDIHPRFTARSRVGCPPLPVRFGGWMPNFSDFFWSWTTAASAATTTVVKAFFFWIHIYDLICIWEVEILILCAVSRSLRLRARTWVVKKRWITNRSLFIVVKTVGQALFENIL